MDICLLDGEEQDALKQHDGYSSIVSPLTNVSMGNEMSARASRYHALIWINEFEDSQPRRCGEPADRNQSLHGSDLNGYLE